jgi:hypothetical protein
MGKKKSTGVASVQVVEEKEDGTVQEVVEVEGEQKKGKRGSKPCPQCGVLIGNRSLKCAECGMDNPFGNRTGSTPKRRTSPATTDYSGAIAAIKKAREAVKECGGLEAVSSSLNQVKELVAKLGDFQTVMSAVEMLEDLEGNR